MSLKFRSIPSKTLTQNLSAAGTTLYLSDTLDWDSTQMSSASFGTQAFAVLRNSTNTQAEFIEIDPATVTSANAITILKRGLGYEGGQVASTETAYAWNAFDTIVELGSDTPQALQYLKDYIDGISIAGASNATSSAKGIVEIATSAEIDAGTATGSTSAILSISPDQLALSQYGTRLPSANEKLAIAGSQGSVGSTNLLISQDNTTAGSTDQSQTTQNATVELGEANSVTKKNKIAQSFVAGKTKISGVKLYKSADTGTFTGTVTIALQANSGSSPSGSSLASVTITNANWLLTATGEFQALFTSEYASLTVGSTYWIVISTSTSDNSNHPNVGTNSAGGYGSGSVKYNNTTDGWVAISTIDLYFKTLEGNASQIAKTGSDGFVPSPIIGTSKKLYISTTEVTFTDGNGGAGAGSEQTLFSTMIPAGLLGTNNGIRFKLYVTGANFNQSASSWTFKVKYGGTTQLTLTNPAISSDVTSLTGAIEGYIIGDGSTSVQKMTAFGTMIGATAERKTDTSVELTKVPFNANAVGAIDSTIDQSLVITLTQTNSSFNDAVVEWCIIESIR